MARKTDTDGQPVGAQSLRQFSRLARLLRARDQSKGLNPAQWEALRYLAVANRFSNTPGALARYLGATKGTISQTVLVLEKKNLLNRQSKPDDRRQMGLSLTQAGHALLREDGLASFADEIETLKPKTRRRFAKGVDELLSAVIGKLGEPSFGACNCCRYFREVGNGEQSRCMKFNVSLSVSDEQLICIEHRAR